MRTKLILFALVLTGVLVGVYSVWDILPPNPQTFVRAPATTSPRVTASNSEGQKEAFLSKLAPRRPGPIDAGRADHFTTQDQLVSFPSDTVEAKTPRSLAAEEADTEKDGAKPVAIAAVVELSPQATRSSVLVDQGVPVVKAPHSPHAATVGELLRQHGKTMNPEDVFYVRTVQPMDNQGIWGIIHDGIIRAFDQGVAIDGGPHRNPSKVKIPRTADEALDDGTSSFLGKLIHKKTVQSYVYNFKSNRMGTNPDLIRPEQEIVIVAFRPAELISIYRYFTGQRG